MKLKKIKNIAIHLFFMLVLSISILYTFFYLVLPYTTNQGKLVQVPDLTGLSLHALDNHLGSYRLRYVITDNTAYSSKLPPFTVLQQFPAKGTAVKENRKIYLTLNAEHPLPVHMPNLIDGSMRQAQLLLTNKGLKLGNIKYVPDITKYAVLEQWHNGHPIPADKLINQGETIDIVVGAGLGKQVIEVPNVLHMSLEEAELLLLEHGIHTKIVHHIQHREAAIGTVLRQNPLPGTMVRLGTAITLWVVGLKSST